MKVPEGFTRIVIDAEHVVDWGMQIKLTGPALALLEQVAGPAMDERFLTEGDQLDPKNETWGWYVEWGGPDAGVIPGKRWIGLFFKEAKHAVYFKTLWGGQ
jgi:hypothetical protein